MHFWAGWGWGRIQLAIAGSCIIYKSWVFEYIYILHGFPLKNLQDGTNTYLRRTCEKGELIYGGLYRAMAKQVAIQRI